MAGTIVQFECPKCDERHVTWECPTCGYARAPERVRLKSSQVTTRLDDVRSRRLEIARIMAEYAAEHPGATDANTNVLDVTLWLAERRSRAVVA
jgi:predicted RNA-binding Zn-ribbon protein involved in translation (DUF1610 family)